MRPSLLVVFCGLFLTTLARAEILSLETLEQRQDEIYDDPKAFRLELEASLQKVQRDADAELWTALHTFAAEAGWFQEDMAIARKHVDMALPVAQEKGLRKLEARLTYLQGGLLEYHAQSEDAEPYFLKSVALAKSIGDDALIAYLCSATGSFFHRSIRQDRAVEFFTESFQRLSKLPQNAAYYDTLSGIGTLYVQIVGPKRDEGLKMLNDAIEYARQHRLRYSIFWVSQSLIEAYKDAKEFDKLDQLYQENLQAAQSLDYPNYIAVTRMDRGTILVQKDRYQEALGDLEHARDYYRNLGISFYDITIVSNLGRIYVALKQYDKIPQLLAEFPNALKESSSTYQKQLIKEMLQVYYKATHQADKELLILRELLDLISSNAEQKRNEDLGRLTRDMELQRQQFLNEKLTDENRVQNAEIQRRERMQKLMLLILLMSAFALAASGVALRRGREIKAQRANLKIILDNIEEGILRFGPDLIIQGEYSRFTSDLLHQTESLRGQSIWDLLFALTSSAGDQQIWKESLRAVFGEERLAWDLNEGNLPQEIRVGDKTLALGWQPLPDATGLTQTVLLLIHDITRQVETQKEVKVAQELVSKMSARIEAIARGRPQRIAQFLVETEKAIQSLPVTFNRDDNHSSIKRTLHTLKGAARSLGLKDISEIVHRWEDLFENLNTASYESHRLDLQNSLHAYRELLPHLDHVQAQSLDNLWDIVAKLLPEARQRLDTRFAQPAQFRVVDTFPAWNRVDTKALQDMLLHAITNCIDHGYLLPLSRGEPVDEAPTLTLEARQQGDQLELSLRDNGAGINWKKLRSMAAERGFQPAPGRELTDLLFMEGTSTAGQLSTTSGRGIGMAAIFDLTKNCGGDVRLLNNEQGTGALLRISLPLGNSVMTAA